MRRKKLAFVCTHNSCRSQMAEAIAKHIAPACEWEFHSAGTEPKEKINQDAVRVIFELYGIDMNASQEPKLVSEIPAVDFVVTMGCGVNCPLIACERREDWGLSDPTGKEIDEFKFVAAEIERRIKKLLMEN